MSSDPHGQDYDPTQPETFDSVYEDFARLRSKCPVAHSNAFDGFWALAKYEDVKAILDQPEMYTTTYKNVVPVMSLTSRRPPLHLDPPEHTPYRQAIDRVLSKKRVEGMKPVIREQARRLVSALVAEGEACLVTNYSRRLPVEVFGEWLSLNDQQIDVLGATSQAYVDCWEAADLAGVQAAGLNLSHMAEDLIAERSVCPLDIEVDPVSSLLAMRPNGEPFPPEKVVACVRQILVIGLVAPPLIIGSVAIHLSRDKALQQQLRENPEQIPAAIEEFLRLYTPYRGFARTAREDVTIGGKHITNEEPIALLYASANRDEEVFENPDEFIMNRPNIAKHLSFGRGPHNCAGRLLATVELTIAVEELLKHTQDFEVSGKIHMSGMPEVGPIKVPMKFTPA
jgi:cytochrome P450